MNKLETLIANNKLYLEKQEKLRKENKEGREYNKLIKPLKEEIYQGKFESKQGRNIIMYNVSEKRDLTFRAQSISKLGINHNISNRNLAERICKKTGSKLKGTKKSIYTIIRLFAQDKLRQRTGDATEFYRTKKWRELRYKVLVKYGRRCACCGTTPDSGAVMHVDHIKPRSKYPKLELDINNLQVLCEDCNIGKLNYSSEDFRDIETPDNIIEMDNHIRQIMKE